MDRTHDGLALLAAGMVLAGLAPVGPAAPALRPRGRRRPARPAARTRSRRGSGRTWPSAGPATGSSAAVYDDATGCEYTYRPDHRLTTASVDQDRDHGGRAAAGPAGRAGPHPVGAGPHLADDHRVGQHPGQRALVLARRRPGDGRLRARARASPRRWRPARPGGSRPPRPATATGSCARCCSASTGR